MKTIAILIAEILVLVGMFYFLYSSVDVNVFLEKYGPFNALITYALFLIIIDAITRSVKYIYIKRNKLNPANKDNFHFGINNIAKLLVGIGLIVTIFGLFGIDIKSLLTSISIVAAAIAIISKEYINDFLVGIYFSFSRNFEINDFVKLGEHKGKILEIEMLKIRLLNDDDDMVIIPNNYIYTNEIINYTKRDIRLMSIDFQVDIKLIESIESLEKELISSLLDFVEFIEPDSYLLKIVEMKKDYVDLKFQYTLKVLDRDLQRQIRKRTVRKVFNSISKKNSIQQVRARGVGV